MLLKDHQNLGMIAHNYSPSTQKTKAGESQVQGQPGLHSKVLSQKKKKNHPDF
jgi:hypothetical protein